MKLISNIPPRRDGTVVVKSPDGAKTFTFQREGHELVCDVDCDATVALLLRSEAAYPADAADFDHAEELVGERLGVALGADDDGLDGEDGADDEGSVNAPPAESNTQPAPNVNKGRKASR